MVGGFPGDPPYAATRAGDGDQVDSAGGRACSFRWIWSRWCMVGTEDEPNGPDAWAARSWRAGTRRAYAQKLAKIAEFEEAPAGTSLARVLAGFLAARAEAGERQSTLRGYNAAVRAAEDLGWIGPTVQQLHKRIAQAASKVGLQPYLPPEGLCVLVERAELQPGALPMACVAVLCWVLWLPVGEVSGLRMGDVSLPYGSGYGIPKLVRRAGNHAPSRPRRIDIVRLCFGGRKPMACGRATTCSLGAVYGWSTSSWKSWAQRLGGTAGGILCAGLAALRVTLATLSCSFSYGGGAGAVSGPPCDMQRRSKMRQSWGLFDCLRRPAPGGQPERLPTWKSGPPICTHRRQSLCRQRHSTPLLGQRTCWTSPPPPLHKAAGGGGGGCPDGREPPDLPWEPLPMPWTARPPPDLGEQEEPSLRSTPVTVPGLRKGGGIGRGGPGGPRSAFTLGTRVGAPASRSKFQGRRREGGHTGKRLDARPVLQARRGPSGVVGIPPV